MSVDAWIQSALDLLEAHQAWAGPITFVLAFGESMVLVGLLLPASVILAGAGILVGWGVLDYWTLVAWGAPGAFLGDAVSFWLGRHYGRFILGLWPLNRRPDLIEYGRTFFLRHGGKSVFIGRFFGPLRAAIPLIAGMMGLSPARFQVANATSAVIWIVGILAPGAMIGFGTEELLEHADEPVAYLALAAGAAVATALFVWLRRLARGSVSI